MKRQPTFKCVFCYRTIPINPLAKSLGGLPIIEFHVYKGKACPGSNSPAETAADRDFRRAFTENKHGELA